MKSGRKKKDVAEEFEIQPSTLCTIINNIKEIDLSFSTDRKRKRDPELSAIEESIGKWFKQRRKTNVSIGDPILKGKLEKFVKSLG